MKECTTKTISGWHMLLPSNNNSPDPGLFTITNRFYKSSYCLKLSIHGNHHHIFSIPQSHSLLLQYHHDSAITIASPPHALNRRPTFSSILKHQKLTSIGCMLPPCPSPNLPPSSHFESPTRTAFPSTNFFSAHPAGPITGSLRPPRTTTFLMGLVFTPRKPFVPASIPSAALQVSGVICSRSLLTSSPAGRGALAVAVCGGASGGGGARKRMVDATCISSSSYFLLPHSGGTDAFIKICVRLPVRGYMHVCWVAGISVLIRVVALRLSVCALAECLLRSLVVLLSL